MNGPLKFLTARKILPLLDLLAKFKRVLAYSCSPNFCVARKLAKHFFFISARTRKKFAVLGMLANARKDHSSPLKNLPAGRFIIVSPSVILDIYIVFFKGAVSRNSAKLGNFKVHGSIKRNIKLTA